MAGPSGPAFLYNFYPRSPCGERPDEYKTIQQLLAISIHALLAESDPAPPRRKRPQGISIHALLAESDAGRRARRLVWLYFYPRSPCGERRAKTGTASTWSHFYPRSPCGERPDLCGCFWHSRDISIHALLAESDLHLSAKARRSTTFLSTLSLRRATQSWQAACTLTGFLSTLSLRRATFRFGGRRRGQKDFYPRSPCGERPVLPRAIIAPTDFYPRSPCGERPQQAQGVRLKFSISIHALLAESDSLRRMSYRLFLQFLSTLSLRRATDQRGFALTLTYISIHALLAESDVAVVKPISRKMYFYPRSPCGE